MVLMAAGSLLAGGMAAASPAAPVEGREFVRLAQTQPTQAPAGRVEVVEFFMFHCGSCNATEATVGRWTQRQRDAISFRRVHMPQTDNDPETRLHLTLEAMGKAGEYVPRVFHAFHEERKQLNNRRRTTDQAVLDWVSAASGLDPAQFGTVWQSFGIQTRLKRAHNVITAYGVTSVPTFVIDGRYLTSPSMIGEANPQLKQGEGMAALEQVLDALLARAKQEQAASVRATVP